VDGSPPFVSVLLATDAGDAQAAARWEQRWKGVRKELEAQLGDASVLDELDTGAVDAHRAGGTFYAVADATSVRILEHWPEQPPRELVRVGSLPTLTPLIASRQANVPHVVALVDREGADIVAAGPGEPQGDSVEGETGPVIRKTNPGGWSQKRYQTRAEEAWARTSRAIADAIAQAADTNGARLVVLAGDVRELELVDRALPSRLHGLVHVVSGGRAAGTDGARTDDAVDRLVRTAVADATVALTHKLREELGQHDRGVVGVAPTFEALQKGQVEVLLVHDDPDDTRTYGDASGARLVDVAIRDAVATGAAVRVMPDVEVLEEGIGALLRWAERSG
jgi:peptide subunit release factor 1 (eRF1)